MALFDRYIGIDYSGAETADSSLSGLRVYVSSHSNPPKRSFRRRAPEVLDAPGSRTVAMRRTLQRHHDHRRHRPRLLISPLLFREARPEPRLVGILGRLPAPLADGRPATCVDFVRDGACGRGDLRSGDPSWMRLTEQWTATAKSVFLFDVQGAVAKSTHAGLPWLRYLRQECQRKIHFWPFDGWDIPQGASVVAEVYPSLWTKRFPRENRDGDQQAAYAVAAWLRRADLNDSLVSFFHPPLELEERKAAEIEGWILGVV